APRPDRARRARGRRPGRGDADPARRAQRRPGSRRHRLPYLPPLARRAVAGMPARRRRVGAVGGVGMSHPYLGGLLMQTRTFFNRKSSDANEGIRQVLNSGYKKGRKVWRCVPPSQELGAFDVYGPKALAGLNELPGTLASRAIPIAMQPPLPTDVWEDLDPEEA